MARAVVVPADAEFSGTVFEAVERASIGKKPFGFFSRDKVAQELFERVRVEGENPSQPEAWSLVLDYLKLARASRGLVDRWNQLAGEFGGPAVIEEWPGNLRQLVAYAETVADVLSLAGAFGQDIKVSIEQTIAQSAELGDCFKNEERLRTLHATIATHIQRLTLGAAIARKEALLRALEGRHGRAYVNMRKLTEDYVGNGEYSSNRLKDIWQRLRQETARLYSHKEDLTFVREMLSKIRSAGAPDWARRILLAEEEQRIPDDWADAWEWARARRYLNQIDSRGRLKVLAEKRRSLDQDLARTTERLVEQRTWLQLKRRLKASISAALAAYLTAITKIGKGTGVRAVAHRRDARNAMGRAQGAVPVWIMPHWRVSETFPAEFGSFDLVIIDEASQSDVWAVPAIVRANKMLIVGDDKQVSPSDVGVKQADIDELRQRFLKDVPYGQHLLPGASIYDLGSVMFASSVVRLREHFRCVEPIIQYSNSEFYDGEIMPLRIPKPSERIDPPLVDLFIKSGYRDGRQRINKPEAKAIVDEIRTISEDPQFANRTIGVVSLLGYEQAKYIQDRLIAELGEEIFVRHKIRCGDAMHFQGKEADIVFVSMVDAGSNIRATAGRMYEQRFNVACSRARDRLYVCHSFTRDQLKDTDLKAKLLDHVANPMPGATAEVGDLRSRCESDFERAVFDELVNIGYRVFPQIRAGGYRIDLVVEGGDDRRLAIECDGDQYHGPDRWLEDLRRQRILERMGWEFWRCWGSSWIATKDACVADLRATLSARGIQPGAPDGRFESPGLVEHRVVGASEEDPVGSAGADSWLEVDGLPEDGNALDGTEEQAAPVVDVVEVGDEILYCTTSNPDQQRRVRIVTGESAPSLGTVNHRTPLAEGFLGRASGDRVKVSLPVGEERYEILEIIKGHGSR